MKDVINKLATDYVTLDDKSKKGHIFNINPICGRWDEAGKIQVKRIDVSINVKEGDPHVNIQHTRNIRFNLESDLGMLAMASADTLVPDNYVELFYETGQVPGTGSDGISRNANIFYLRMLTKNPFNFSVANLCEAYSTAQMPRKTMEDAMDVVLNENKLSLFSPTKSLKSKLTNYFATQGVFAPDQMNFLNIKRSADYGQIYLVKKLNDVASANIEMYAYNFFTEDKKVHKRGKYPLTMKLEDRLINKWVLLTGDKLCYARARLEGVPCIFYKDGKGLEFYAGSAVAATSSGPVIDDKMTKIINFITEFEKVVDKIGKAAPTPIRLSILIITFLSNRLQQIQTENQHIKNQVMTHSTSYDTELQKLLGEFNNVTNLIFDIQKLKFKFDHGKYLTTITSMRTTLTTDEDDVLIDKLREHEDELKTIIEYYNKNKQTTLPDIPNCLSFAECSLFHQVLSIDSSKIVLTTEEHMSDEFVKQWHTLNIFSPIIRKGTIHDFLLTSELGTEMRRLLLSDKTRTVDALINELSFWLGRPIRSSRRTVAVGDVILYNPLECVTYVLCKEIEKGTDEITSLIGKLKDLHNELTKLNTKLSNQSSPPELGSPGPPSPRTPSGPPSSHGSLSSMSSIDSPGPSLPQITARGHYRREELLVPPLSWHKGGTTINPGESTENYDYDNPSYFCLNTYFSQLDHYLYSYVSHDDIIELQHVVNFIFYICDVNINQYVNENLGEQFIKSYKASLPRSIEKNFYVSKVLIYASIKKVLIQMLTQITFAYGWAKFVTEALAFISPSSSIYEYLDNNDFISEINERIKQVQLTTGSTPEGDRGKWGEIFSEDPITLCATQDIITNEYLLDSTSKTFLKDQGKDEKKLAFILCTYTTLYDINKFILDEMRPTPSISPSKRSAPSHSEVSSVQELPTINFDDDDVTSKLFKPNPNRVVHGKNTYITKYEVLSRELRNILSQDDSSKHELAKKFIHCINLAKHKIISGTGIKIQDKKAYYNIVNHYRDKILFAAPHGGTGKAKSNKPIAKFRLQDYHKKYYPLYYQIYYGNGNE